MQGTDNKLQYYHDKLAKAIEDGVDFEEFREIFKEYWSYTVDISNTFGFRYTGKWDCVDTHIRILVGILERVYSKYKEYGCYDERVKSSYCLAEDIAATVGFDGIAYSQMMIEVITTHPTLVQSVVRELVNIIKTGMYTNVELCKLYRVISSYDRGFPYI